MMKMPGAEVFAGINKVLDERADLHGVLPLADVIYESTRWSA